MTLSALFDLLFTFQGRINRAKMWLFVLIWACAILLGVALIFMAGQLSKTAGTPIALLFLPILLAMFVALFATGIKRLHDRGYSGWMIILFYVVPGVLESIGRSQQGWILPAIAFAISVWSFVELFVLRGTVGPNEYGPDPLDPMLGQSVADVVRLPET
jgi:uncharacterized membrane protein YhaH (DUF805 family)